MTGITETLSEDLCTFVIISRAVLLRMRNASEKYSRENQNTHFMFKFPPPPARPENCAFDEIMWKNIGEVTDGNIIWCVRFTCWIPEATDSRL